MYKYMLAATLLISAASLPAAAPLPAATPQVLTASANYVVPELKIPELKDDVTFPLGDLVGLSLSPVLPRPEHWVSHTVTWKVLYRDEQNRLVNVPFRMDDQGIFFASGLRPRVLTVVASVTHLYIQRDSLGRVNNVGVRNQVLVETCRLGEGPDPGPVPPPPPPPPPPDLPDGKYQLAKFTYEAVMAHTPVEKRVEGAKASAVSMKGVASRIAAGTLSDAEAILRATDEANTAALSSVGIAQGAWKPFGIALQKKLVELDRSNQMRSATDYQTAWTEIAMGLEAVK